MAWQKTWQFVSNYVPTNASAANLAKNMIWFWSRVLLGDVSALTFKDTGGSTLLSVTGKWFVWGSSNGTSFSNGGTSGVPATDYWTSTFNAANIVQAAAGANHSWIVLGSPSNFGGTGVGPFYIYIDCNSATGTQVSVSMSKNAPNVNGSLTAKPTATDEVALLSAPATFTITSGSLNYHISACISTDGVMRLFQSRDGDGGFNTYFGVEAFADYLAGDTWPAAFSLYYAQPTASGWVFGQQSIGWSSTAFTPSNTNGCWRGRSMDGSSILSFTIAYPSFWDTGAGAIRSYSSAIASNVGSGKWDNLPYVGIFAPTGQVSVGWRGRLYDVGWSTARKYATPNYLNDGDYDSTNLAMTVGDTWQPAVAAPAM